MSAPRLALFTLEALPNAAAVRQLVEERAASIAFVALSNPHRPQAGGFIGQIIRHLERSGPLFLPYLAVNFAIPDMVWSLYPLVARRRRVTARGTPLEFLCREKNIPVVRLDDANGAQTRTLFDEHRPDLIVSFHFDQIFTPATLGLAPLGGVNVHPSLLPLHRGPPPTIHALGDEPPVFGATVHRLATQIDAGSILAQARASLPPGCSATGAAIALHELGGRLLSDVLETIGRTGMPEGVPQHPSGYCPFPSASLLWSLLRRGRRLTRWRDLGAAFGRRTAMTETLEVVLDPSDAQIPSAPPEAP